MFDFFIRKSFIRSAQKYINGLNPKTQIHLHDEMLLPSVSLIKKLSPRASRINALEEKISALTNDQLRLKTNEFREKIAAAVAAQKKLVEEALSAFQNSATTEAREENILKLNQAEAELYKAKQVVLDMILEEAFAVVRETGKRVIGLRHFDVQMIGGMVLHSGCISEMTTGEGKTLVATLPAYLNALTGDGVHVVTVNDYLARRDREWMGPIYEFLGLTIGAIQHDMMPRDRKAAYACDITYGTNNEYGFDYLRDNMVSFKEEMVQRGHHFAIVDEVDSILVDEARTPLIISGPAEESTDKYYTASRIVPQLKGRRITEQEEVDAKHRGEELSKGFDYVADEKAKSISMTETGEEKAAQAFGVANLHEMETIEYRHHMIQALRSKEFFHRDTDYVVNNGQVIIVDEFTGRMMPGRRWSDGLHQAVEAKEGIKIERENQTLATITFQNYFRMYSKLAGMTGTAYTEANEFKQIYKLDCVVIPTNRPLSRKNFADCIYKSAKEKYEAVVSAIEEHHKQGQPVLVGTISIEKSELLSRLLKERGVPHQVLNAKYHEREAQIIAQAGRYKGVTIATNMAGRGTDIVLGGNAEYLARTLAEEKMDASKEKDNEKHEAMVQSFLAQFREQTKKEHDQVVEVGGLHVLGTERHESRRIDNQLRGRCGRQGDPGSSRFYVSLEDDLMRLFASDRIKMVMERLGMEEGQVIESPMVSRALEIAQKRVENFNFEIRKQLLEYDNVMNKQREVIYNLRRSILEGENIKEHVVEAIKKTAVMMVERFLPENIEQAKWDLDGFEVYLKSKFDFELAAIKDKILTTPREQLTELIQTELMFRYEAKEKEISAEHMRGLERALLLHIIDTKWKDHLHAMDQVKEGIGLRAFGQRDPLVEYKREGFAMFGQMYSSINEEVAETIFRMQFTEEAQRARSVFSALPKNLVHNEFSGLAAMPQQRNPQAPSRLPMQTPAEGRPAPVAPVRSQPKVGRNDPCPCGSGKKYKKCCGASE